MYVHIYFLYIMHPVTRLIPVLSKQLPEKVPNAMICVRTCGRAGIIDNDIRVNYETVDGTASNGMAML